MTDEADIFGLLAALKGAGAKVTKIEGIDRRGDVTLDVAEEAAVATLTEVLANYQGGCKYGIGQFVTPRKGSNYRASGMPHIVAEVFSPPMQVFKGSPSSARYGRKIDMRVFTIYGDEITAFAVESWAFVPWTPKEVASGGQEQP